jgi:hypothetical protein
LERERSISMVPPLIELMEEVEMAIPALEGAT